MNTKFKIFYSYGLEKLILLKFLYYPKWPTVSMQSLSNGIFHKNTINRPEIYTKPQKNLNSQSDLEKEEQS